MPYDSETYVAPEKVDTLPAHKQLLVRALDRIRHEGWCQGRAWDGYGYCALGSVLVQHEPCEPILGYAIDGNAYMRFACEERMPGSEKAIADIAKAMGLPESTPPGYIIDWNDTEGRTKEEMIAVLEKAISL